MLQSRCVVNFVIRACSLLPSSFVLLSADVVALFMFKLFFSMMIVRVGNHCIMTGCGDDSSRRPTLQPRRNTKELLTRHLPPSFSYWREPVEAASIVSLRLRSHTSKPISSPLRNAGCATLGLRIVKANHQSLFGSVNLCRRPFFIETDRSIMNAGYGPGTPLLIS